MNNMLTLEEVKNYLETDQDQIEKYIKQSKLHAYKIGGAYIRFRKEEVLSLRSTVIPSSLPEKSKVTFFSRLYDFWRFNNFYIVSILFIIAIGVYIVKN